ncbi:MAG: hypothetical protein AAF943_15300 [Pseudomonadota bacterium]
MLIALVQGLLGFGLLALSAQPVMALARFDWLLSFGVVIGFIFLGIAAFFFGLARRQPVALHMDESGILGYYVDPTPWEDVAQIHEVTGRKGERYLGFEVKDLPKLIARQSPWRRFFTASNARNTKAHMLVPQIVLQGTTVDALARQAEAFLAGAKVDSGRANTQG